MESSTMDFKPLMVGLMFLGGGIGVGITAYAAIFALTEGVSLGRLLIFIALAEFPVILGALFAFII